MYNDDSYINIKRTHVKYFLNSFMNKGTGKMLKLVQKNVKNKHLQGLPE